MNRFSPLLWSFVAALGLTGGAFAQGTDDCAAPTAIAGVGSFAFSTTSATTGSQGQANALCDQFGEIGIARDVWFAWTAPSTGTFSASTCSGASYDSKIAVYAGSGCPGAAPLACNDDACATQSSASFSATSGLVYTIQLGSYPAGGGSSGSGSLTLAGVVPCGGNPGPDVIVGDLQEIQNYSASGGIDAISLGTYSCNIGTTNLSWIAGNNQHPVIGGTLYRWRTVSGAGRFEQIGMSWLKHGFFALSNTLCCPGCQGTDGTSLGVNCADPYTAARNGTQSGLGPRSQVNAHTGAYTYPPANPSWSGGVARRLQYLQSDVDTNAGVRYFGEGQYVTPDDAAAGNQNNNASYRELSVNGAGSSFSFVGTTQREKSAIRAWPLVETGVVLNDIQVAGDGLYILGYKTTSLGGGQYHYEYAVYNMNGDRNGGSFSIPLPGGVTLSNIGFHDVDYRNNDGDGNTQNFSGTDWTVTQTGSSITWACETQGANNNANALRWGSTYNFRFDADAAPAVGLATLGLWKTGSPANVTSSVEVPGGGPFALFCAGDGTGTSCPCANNSPIGNNEGCLSSLAQGGRVRASGTASIGADSLSLTCTQVPNGPALYFQGSGQTSIPFGDGLLCMSGTIIRLGVVFATGNTSTFPSGALPSISVQGLNSAGAVRNYQAWYRDAAVHCTASTFNLTNGLNLTWAP